MPKSSDKKGKKNTSVKKLAARFLGSQQSKDKIEVKSPVQSPPLISDRDRDSLKAQKKLLERAKLDILKRKILFN